MCVFVFVCVCVFCRCVIPYSHYWTTNHEDSSDNFSGPDHLFTHGGSRDGERPQKDPADLVERDELINGAVSGLGWPLVKQHKVIVPAGSAVLCSHNIYHRASRRNVLDDDRPRYMWRTWIYRTTEPHATADFGDKDKDSFWTGLDALTGIEATEEATQDAVPVWDAMLSYAANLPPRVLPVPAVPGGVQSLVDGLRAPGISAEPTRIAAAYRLAALTNADEAAAALAGGLGNDRENVRRAATYGMAAMGAAGKGVALAAVLCELTTSAAKSVRKHAAFALGESAPLTVKVVAALTTLLEHEPSVYVRTNSAGALGLIGIRHIGRQAAGAPAAEVENGLQLLPMVLRALVECLEREENRLDQSIRQRRGLKQCIVDDFSDLCEGGGVSGRQDGDATHQRLYDAPPLLLACARLSHNQSSRCGLALLRFLLVCSWLPTVWIAELTRLCESAVAHVVVLAMPGDCAAGLTANQCAQACARMPSGRSSCFARTRRRHRLQPRSA